MGAPEKRLRETKYARSMCDKHKLQNQLYINWWKRKEMIKGTKYA